MNLNIKERFERLLPPLSADEFAMLEASIRTDGVREPIVVWENTILDGHNRYKIATKHELPFTLVDKTFEDEDDACIWIIENQTGKRNLTDVQRSYQRGELYKLRKKKHGGDRKSEDFSSGKSCHLKTEDEIAVSQNVSARTVRNDADFHTAVNEVAEATGQSAHDILDLAEKTSKQDVIKIAKMTVPLKKEVIAKLQNGEVDSLKQIEIQEAQQRNLEQTKAIPTKPMLHIGDGVDWIDQQEPCDLLLTDPPYMTDVEDIEAFALDWLPIALSKVKTTGFAFVFIGAYPDEVQAYVNAKSPPNVELCQILVWTYKNTLGNNPKDRYKQNYQNILFYRGVDAPDIDCPVTNEQWAVMDINAPDGRQGDRFHSWQKPMELAERLIRHTTKQGDTVYDPFACTGTFLLAANKLGRNGIGAEINEENAKIAIKRGVRHE